MTLALLAGATLVARRQWFPSAREPGYRAVATFGATPGPGRLEGPIGVALLDGEVFVADFYNHRIQRFTAAGDFLVAFGSPGAGPAQLDRPTDMAVADDGTVYVTDFGNGRVQTFVPVQGDTG